LFYWDESCGLRIILRPDISKLIKSLLVKHSALLSLGVIESLENNSNEKIQENQINKYDVAVIV